jgi:hypothetical protein
MDSRASAMKGDIVRALVELITNADDAYGVTALGSNASSQPIHIHIERKRKSPSIISVTDNATGMSAEEMRAKLTQPGNRTSGFHAGVCTRGLHGRGAKDVSYFGKTVFESIKDNYLSTCTIEQDLSCSIITALTADADRKRLGIKRCGTRVTIHVVPGFTIPTLAFFTEKFPRHFVLSHIFTSRHVTISEGNTKTQVAYAEPVGEVIVDKTINMSIFPPINNVLPMAHVIIKSAPDAFNDEKHGPMAPYRYSGLTISSGVAIHEKHLFNHEASAEAQNIFGAIECPYIDELVRHYDLQASQRDTSHPRWNNVRALDERRDGLIKEHPVLLELFRQVSLLLDDIVAARRSEMEKRTVIRSSSIDRWLRDAMKRVSMLLEQKLNGSPLSTQLREPRTTTPEIIPDMFGFSSAAYQITPGKERRITVRFKGDFPEQPDFDIQCSEPEIKMIVPDSFGYVFNCDLNMHEWSAHILSAKLGATGTLTATLGPLAAQAEVKVVQREESQHTLLKPPKILDEDWGSVRVKWSAEDPGRLEIAARHPAFAPYLGSPAKGYPGRDSEGYRAVLGEAIAEALTWRVLEKRHSSIGSREEMTATDYYTEFSELMRDFISVITA